MNGTVCLYYATLMTKRRIKTHTNYLVQFKRSLISIDVGDFILFVLPLAGAVA